MLPIKYILQLPAKRVFFIDSFGALYTAFMTGYIFAFFQSYIGMPLPVLFTLSLVALGMWMYGFVCGFTIQDKWPRRLKTLALLNLLYCAATLALVVYHWSIITALGKSYFFIEITVISFLAYMELRKANSAAS